MKEDEQTLDTVEQFSDMFSCRETALTRLYLTHPSNLSLPPPPFYFFLYDYDGHGDHVEDELEVESQICTYKLTDQCEASLFFP